MMYSRGDSSDFYLGLFVIVFIASIVFLVRFLKKRKVRKERKKYESEQYYQVTKVPYEQLRRDVGKNGEYSIYEDLKEFEKEGNRFLFNLYVPKNETEKTEIDVVMISSAGILVFESKNYSGWIFGNDRQATWTQTLPGGAYGGASKEHFYNPILQNNQHIKALRSFLQQEIPYYSVIVFSDYCTFKKLTVADPAVHVIHLHELVPTVTGILQNAAGRMSNEDVALIYEKLYPLTQVSEEEKEAHVQRIRQHYQGK